MRSHASIAKPESNSRSLVQRKPALRIGDNDDAYEQEADRTADAVINGGAYGLGRSLSKINITSSLQRQPKSKPKSEEEKYKEAAKKLGEAFLETGPGKEIKAKAEKLGEAFISTLPGKIITGSAITGAVAALAATHKELPIGIPEIPLDVIRPGLKLKLTYEGPVDKPTKVMASFSIPLGAPKASKKPAMTKAERFRAETARMAEEQYQFRESMKTPEQRAEDQRMMDAWLMHRMHGPDSPLSLGIPGIGLGKTGGGLPPPLAPYAPEFKISGEQPKTGEPEKKEEEATIQRKSNSSAHENGTPAIVNDVLQSPGQPLERNTRSFMESRFGYDLSHVRIHTDPKADTSARATDAAAYTAGNHVVFAQGQYHPHTRSGRHLLAHELTHVIQQESSSSRHQFIQQRSIFETAGVFLGLIEGTFEETELMEYLKKITRNKKIEDSYDSDNKARAIVKRWHASEPKFNLLPEQKVLLIKEMLAGPTLGEDESRILDLLEFSDNVDLRRMFSPGGVSLKHLEKDLNGESGKRLSAFIVTRFKGGRAAVLKGSIDMIGSPAKGAPKFPYDWTLLKARIDGDYSVDEIVEIISGYDSASREKALRDIGRERTVRQRKITALHDTLRKEKDPLKQKDIKKEIKARTIARTKLDRILQPIFKEIAITETPFSLIITTAAPTAAEKKEILKALKPDVKVTKSGKPEPFVPVLVGETKSYEQKLRNYMPKMIQVYYDKMVKGRGKKEHADPTKVHSLKEFEEIGKISQKETDAVFGKYKTGPALKADTATKRGNIHDLFTEMESDLKKMSRKQRRDLARKLIFYFFQTNRFVRNLNRQHNASPKFDKNNKPINDEAKSLTKLAKESTRTRKDIKRLNEIDRGWAATAGGGEINIKIFKGKTVDKDRDFLWDMFQTLIHEYLHTLADGDYKKYADSFGDTSNEYNTLIEGVDSLLTEIVWSNVEPRVNNPDLRAKIEGSTYSKLPPIKVKPASRRRYPSYTEAIKLANIVGIRNIYAAYFLGDVKKIGG